MEEETDSSTKDVEKKVRKEYMEEREKIKRVMKPTDGRSMLLWRTFSSIKKEIIEKDFSELNEKMEKKICPTMPFTLQQQISLSTR